MKKLLLIIGFIAAILATVLAVTPLFKLSLFPTALAILCGFGLFYLNKKKAQKTKFVQYVFLLSIIALSLTIYKSIFTVAELGDTEELNKLEEKSEEEAIELLEGIEID